VDYDYDVFLSYRRSNFWPKYVKEHFLPKFRHWLGATLGREPEIYFDEEVIRVGDTWPRHLADGLAHSRVLVCLWTKEYFSSEWCKRELSHMLARRQFLTEGPQGPPRLIFAVLLHDSEDIDEILTDIQQLPLQKYCNPWMYRHGITAERLSMRIEKFATDVAGAVAQAPNFDPGWAKLTGEEFWGLFEGRAKQEKLPSLGGPVTS
jgi:hypothetical protein